MLERTLSDRPTSPADQGLEEEEEEEEEEEDANRKRKREKNEEENATETTAQIPQDQAGLGEWVAGGGGARTRRASACAREEAAERKRDTHGVVGQVGSSVLV